MQERSFQPGEEVVLASGQTGVLYARVSKLGRRRPFSGDEVWYFLPDIRGAVGLVVMGQPREVAASQVRSAGVIRPGPWPSPHYRLSTSQRQAVYVAHMQQIPLPPLEA